tara:strand:+ start:675 stop:1508 length:834 start_codon:yes stop_codon:yes gene_type:complete
MAFMQSQKAQQIIADYLDKPYQTPPAINPIFDLRDPGQDFPPLNPPVQTDPIVDPCPPGYQLIDGVCQPIDQFGGDMPNEVTGGGGDEVEERPYFSIDEMRDLSDDDLIDYLSSGFLTNSGMLGYLPSRGGQVTFKDGFGGIQGSLLQLPFGNQSALRKDAMENELMRRGFFTGQFDENLNRIYDIQSEPDKSILFQPRADTNEADVTYGGNQNIITDAGGSYGGGEDFGSPFTSDYQGGYQGNVVVNNQQIQNERDRIEQVVKDMQSGKKTTFGGL